MDGRVAYAGADLTQNIDDLKHYGVLGMKWGVRRSEEQLARAAKRRGDSRFSESDDSSSSGKSTTSGGESSDSSTNKTKGGASAKSLSDKELKDAVNRMEKEKQYTKLLSEQKPKTVKDGIRDFVVDEAKKQTKRAASRAATEVTNMAMDAAMNSDGFKKAKESASGLFQKDSDSKSKKSSTNPAGREKASQVTASSLQDATGLTNINLKTKMSDRKMSVVMPKAPKRTRKESRQVRKNQKNVQAEQNERRSAERASRNRTAPKVTAQSITDATGVSGIKLDVPLGRTKNVNRRRRRGRR